MTTQTRRNNELPLQKPYPEPEAFLPAVFTHKERAVPGTSAQGTLAFFATEALGSPEL